MSKNLELEFDFFKKDKIKEKEIPTKEKKSLFYNGYFSTLIAIACVSTVLIMIIFTTRGLIKHTEDVKGKELISDLYHMTYKIDLLFASNNNYKYINLEVLKNARVLSGSTAVEDLIINVKPITLKKDSDAFGISFKDLNKKDCESFLTNIKESSLTRSIKVLNNGENMNVGEFQNMSCSIENKLELIVHGK